MRLTLHTSPSVPPPSMFVCRIFTSETGHRELLPALPAADQRDVPCPRLLPWLLLLIQGISRRNVRHLGRPVPVLPEHPRRCRPESLRCVVFFAGGRGRPRLAGLGRCPTVRRTLVVAQSLLGTCAASDWDGVAAVQDHPGQPATVAHAVRHNFNSSRCGTRSNKADATWQQQQYQQAKITSHRDEFMNSSRNRPRGCHHFRRASTKGSTTVVPRESQPVSSAAVVVPIELMRQ
jgi:hypothetical protein